MDARGLPLVAALFCACFVCCAHGRYMSKGDLIIPCQGSCPAANIDPTSAQAMPAGCADSAVADIPARWQLPQYSSTWKAVTTSDKKWRPYLSVYQPVLASQVSPSCNPTAWAWARLMRVVTDTIALQINYCHHHAPSYLTPTAVRDQCNPTDAGVDGGSCVCNAAGMTKANPWRGVDCSNFAAFALNLAFGFYPTSSIGEMACDPTYAPGRLLTSVTTSKLNLLRPGDLVFITVGSTGRTPPVRVSHVVFWTGMTVDFAGTGPTSKAALMANVPDYQQAGVERCMAEKQAAGQPVYVIADSHNNGPELRPFCGWYISSFSHARRVINPDPSLPVNDPAIAFWDDASGSCQSNWALRV